MEQPIIDFITTLLKSWWVTFEEEEAISVLLGASLWSRLQGQGLRHRVLGWVSLTCGCDPSDRELTAVLARLQP